MEERNSIISRAMLAIPVNQVHQVIQVQWVILVHQVQHFRANEVKRVFQVQLVSTTHFYFLFTYYIFFQIGIPGPQGIPGAKGEPGINKSLEKRTFF
jgi:hypothetical protein